LFLGELQKNNSNNDMFFKIFLILISGFIGWAVGYVKSFRDEKQKAYGDILPPILKMVYNPESSVDEKEFSRALSKLWIYGSKTVTQKMENALTIMHDHSKGDVTKALQEAVVEMRKDIQIWPWQKLKPQDVNHLYTRIAGMEINNEKFNALREIKSVIANIPPDLNKEELEGKLNAEPEFCRGLTNRLVGLFGLRNELIPFMEPELIDLIDKQMEPLFIIENGIYTFRTEKISEFANFADKAKSLVASIEAKLTKEYKQRLK
jgi:hypothetical protein